MRTKLLAVVAVLAAATVGLADDGLSKGTPDLKSATTLAFGAKGLLFVGDSQGAAIFAIDTGDKKTSSEKPVNVERIDAKVGAALGVTEKEVRINDLKVNPASGNIYLAVTRGTGAGEPAIIKVTRDGTIEPMSLNDVMFSKVSLPNASDKPRERAMSITNMAFLGGRVFVAGLSNEEFASTLWALPFPFGETNKGTGIQIFHGAHGKLETQSPIRTFTPYKIGKEENIIASYTCTPLVKIPVDELKPGAKVKGTTIAELGNMNQPLAMISYTKDGKDYLLSANSRHGLIKIPTETFASAEAINDPVRGGGTAGVKYEKIPEFKTDVTKLDKLDDGRAVLVLKTTNGFDIKTIPLP
jgi:secreted PhoX family phosphatase